MKDVLEVNTIYTSAWSALVTPLSRNL